MTPTERINIDLPLVRGLLAAQFPQWADLPIRPVELQGHDNKTFRLGGDMSVRLPSAAWYAAQVEKEQSWLPRLAPHLPLPIPMPIAKGEPSADYPWQWSIYRWLDGEPTAKEGIADPCLFATTLAQFIVALQAIDPAGGPPPGKHNFLRGASPAAYDAEARDAILALHGKIDTGAITEVWDASLKATWHGPPVWLHGDIAASNLLVEQGQLIAVIDFGCSAVGDPACDLVIAWTLFSGESRKAFRAAIPVDAATWARGRGWALWKALITLAEHIDADALEARNARTVIDEVLADHARGA